MYTDKYWNRKSRKSKPFKTRALFHLAYLGTLLTVCIINYIVVYSLGSSGENLPILWVIPAYLIAVYFGGKLLISSKVPWISFVGTSLVGLPLGLVVYSLVGGEIDLFLMQVLLTTTLSVIGLGLFQVFTCNLKIPHWSSIATSLALAVFINIAFTTNLRETPAMNWLIVLFVNARIGHMWGEARVITPTVDNGIDGVGVLLLESLNPLFYYERLQTFSK